MSYLDEIKLPEVIVFAGPNGSGKSTITQVLKPDNIDYINADNIKVALDCTDLEAAQEATRLRESHLADHKPFCFETVLSTDRNLNLLQRARKAGFFIRTYIVVTSDSSINIGRVKSRVLLGGHDVPVEKIVSRYNRSLHLVKDVVKTSNVCNIYDNSSKYPIRFFNKKINQYYYQESTSWTLNDIKILTGIPKLQQRDLNIDNTFKNIFMNKTYAK